MKAMQLIEGVRMFLIHFRVYLGDGKLGNSK